MSYKNLIFEKSDGMAQITINRPEKLNALNLETLAELQAVLQACTEDVTIRAVMISGSGQKAFVAGADIEEIAMLDQAAGQKFSRAGQDVFNLIENSEKPVVAAVNGFALGGGCELAMACHFRIAGEQAKFGQPEINLGLIPGFGGTQRLARIIGKGMALELCLTGKIIDAAEAYRLGLVNRVVPAPDLRRESEAIVRKIIAGAPLATAAIIRCINLGMDNGLENGLQREADEFGKICVTHDKREGTAAFLQKRPAKFKGS